MATRIVRGKLGSTKSSELKPIKTTSRSNRLLFRLARVHHLTSELMWMWRERVSVNTVYRHFRARGMRKRKRLICPLLTAQHREARLRWCMTRIIWRKACSRVVFCDERRFCSDESWFWLGEWEAIDICCRSMSRIKAFKVAVDQCIMSGAQYG